MNISRVALARPEKKGDGYRGRYPWYEMRFGGNDLKGLGLTPDEAMDVVESSKEELLDAVRRVLARNSLPYRADEQRVRVPALVDLETWVNDCAVYVKTERFDCELALDEFGVDELPAYASGFSDGACNYGDDVLRAAAKLGLAPEWVGPFEFQIADWYAYDRYMEARVRDEYGCELREV